MVLYIWTDWKSPTLISLSNKYWVRLYQWLYSFVIMNELIRSWQWRKKSNMVGLCSTAYMMKEQIKLIFQQCILNNQTWWSTTMYVGPLIETFLSSMLACILIYHLTMFFSFLLAHTLLRDGSDNSVVYHLVYKQAWWLYACVCVAMQNLLSLALNISAKSYFLKKENWRCLSSFTKSKPWFWKKKYTIFLKKVRMFIYVP